MFSSTPPQDASSFLLGPGPPIVTGDSERGPPGCNLFVFHLPNELTNWDLYLLFRKYGTIISVHTMINKNTGLSRGFGFVSLSKEEEAIAAVRSMDGFRLGKKRLKVQRKREHEEDDEGFAQDFDNLCGYPGFPSISISSDQMTPPSSSSSTPRYSGSSAASPLTQPPSASRFNSQMLNSPTAALGNEGSLTCPIGRMLPIGSVQHREPSSRGHGLNKFASCDINQEASHLRVSFEKENRLDLGSNSLRDDYPEPYSGNLPRSIGGPPAQRLQQGLRGAFIDTSHYDPRANMSMGSADGENHYGSRSLLRDTGIGSRSRVNLGAHTDVGRPGYLAVHSEDSVIGRSPAVVYREDRVRERRNSDDSFFYSRRLFDDSQETSSTTSPGLSLPPTPRQSRQLFYQAAYQLQQQLEEDAQGCPRVCDYELERRERSRSSSTIGSHSAEGKTSAETTERDVSIDKIGEILQNGLEKSLDDENFNGDQHFQPQQYVYDEREGQYILR